MEIIKRHLIDHWGRRRDDFNWRNDQRPLDLTAVESVLVLHLNDKLGDGLVISLLVDALARACPRLAVSVGTTAAYEAYWRAHPHVRDVVVMPPSRKLGRRTGRRIREAKHAGRAVKGRFTAVVSFEPYALPDHFALLRAIGASYNIGFNKHPYQLFEYSLEERRHGVHAEPVAARTASVMQVFDHEVDLKALNFHVPYGPDEERIAQSVVDRLSAPGARLLFNVYGAGPEKRLTPESVVRIVRELRNAGPVGPIYLSVPTDREAAYREAIERAGLAQDLAFVLPLADFKQLFALVAKMDVVVSPDTAVGHVAAAFDKPQVVLFAHHGTVPIAWKPFSDRCVSVLSQDGKDVNALDWEAFTKAVRRALSFLQAKA